MEEVLKGLKGKSLTKKKLLDFLLDIDLNDLYRDKKGINLNEIKVNEVSEIVDRKITDQFDCDACKKSFTTKSSLKRHHDRFPVCKDWIELPQKSDIELTTGIHHIVDELLQKSISEDDSTTCKYCKTKFSNTGNHHKHYNTSTICNKMAFQEFKKLLNAY